MYYSTFVPVKESSVKEHPAFSTYQVRGNNVYFPSATVCCPKKQTTDHQTRAVQTKNTLALPLSPSPKEGFTRAPCSAERPGAHALGNTVMPISRCPVSARDREHEFGMLILGKGKCLEISAAGSSKEYHTTQCEKVREV
jgi:hypothetical protein